MVRACGLRTHPLRCRRAVARELDFGRAFRDLAPMISSCYNGMVYHAHGADKVRLLIEKPSNVWTVFQEAWSFLKDSVAQLLSISSIRGKVQVGPRAADMLGPDPWTTILVWLAFILTAAIAALCVDLWLWPGNARVVIQASTTREPTMSATGPPAWSTSNPSPAPSTSAELGTAPIANPTPAPSVSPAAGASPTPYLLPTQGPLPTTAPSRVGVRIRIPAIGVERSIVEVPLTYDSHSRSWTRDYGQLLPRGRPDLVGHLAESASPGQRGNTILVGHNYGYGVNAVFLRLGQLRVGHQVEIVNASGQTYNYRVTDVASIPWTKKDQQELLRHQAYLSTDGPERLTLVTCSGSSWAPFPQRVYVVAVPVH